MAKKKEVKKNNNILKVVGIIIVLVVGVSLFFILTKDNETKKEDKNKNIVTKEGNNYVVKMNENKVVIEDVVEFKKGSNVSYADITIKDLKVDGKDIKIEMTNIPSNNECKNDENPRIKELKINDNSIYIAPAENCYDVSFKEIIIIEDKYIGIVYETEYSLILSIYSTDIERVYEKNTILTIDTDKLKFTAFEELDKDYIINKYELRFDEGVTDYIYEVGKESYCSEDKEFGKC